MTRLAAFMAVLLLAAASIAASARHEITYKGAVVSADARQIVVTVVNEKTKKPESMTFKYHSETKFLRGDKVVTFKDAQILKGDKVAVTINHDDLPDFALVVRLDAKK